MSINQTLLKRKSNRLPYKHLYESGYWYFVTICVFDHKPILSSVGAISQSPEIQHESSLHLTIQGKIVEKEWNNLLNHFKNIYLDEYVAMPNHFHAIIGFDGTPYSVYNHKEANLSNIIKRFKQESTFQIRSLQTGDCEIAPTKKKQIWQKSFYDHVIRDEKDLIRIREYIKNNPLKWQLDEYYTI